MKRSVLVSLCCCALLAGCATALPPEDGQVSAEDVMRRIKDELTRYFVYMHAHERDPALANACRGKIDFTIKSVTVTLTSQAEDTADVNASATIPIGAVAALGPAFGASRGTRSSTTMKYTFYPVDPGPAPPVLTTASQWVGYPIASSIEQLRESLLKASDTRPCMRFTPPDDPGPPVKNAAPADQSVAFDFAVTRAVKGGVALKFVLFALGADASRQRRAGNSVLVVFNATPKSMGFHSLANAVTPRV